MKSSINQASLGFSLCNRKTRKAIFLDQMDRVVPWARLVDLIAPHYPDGRIGRPPFPVEVMLRTHFLQQWFNLSDPAMEEAFFDTPLYREFVDLGDNVRLPDESTILRFRHLLEEHNLAAKMLAEVNAVLTERGLLLKEGSAVDATLIAAPSSTKNQGKARDPEMHTSQKGNQWHFGMKAHIGVDADSGLVHTVRCTSGNDHDITQAHRLLHGQETTVWADAGYQGVQKRPGADPDVTWHVAMRPGKRKVLKHAGQMGELLNKAEKLKAGIRAKVEHRPVSGDQALVRLCEDPLPGLEEERGSDRHVVCVVQFADGAPGFDGGAGMSAPKLGHTGHHGGPKASQTAKNGMRTPTAGH